MNIKKIFSVTVATIFISTSIIVPKSYANQENEYETYIKTKQKSYNFENNDLPEEVKSDLKEENNIKYFKLKTDSNYEIALAYENGKYTFYKEAKTLEEAKSIANDIKDEYIDQDIIPTVINNEGIIEYTTNSIGRIVKIGDGISENATSFTVNLYKDSDKKSVHTYINHGYIDDVPILDETSTMIKIEVAGFIGWMEKEDSQGINIVKVPINQAKNLSYYQNENGQLIHYISSNVEGGTGSKRSIGRAPSFMNSGVKYYSYDGNYFYTDIEKLISDAKANNHSNAVNHNTFYNYYQYLSLRSKASYTAEDINIYFDNNTSTDSVLRNTGEYFIKAQSKYGVNASAMVGIAMNESAKGTSTIAKTKNNIFGINAVDNNPNGANYFNSIEDCIDTFATEYMTNGYLNPKSWKYYSGHLGNKSLGCNVKYASDPYWGEKASSFMHDINTYLFKQGKNDDYNRYTIGIVNKNSDVNNKDGISLYTASQGHVVLVSDNREKNIEINPDRITPLNVTNPIPGSYDWTIKGYISKSNVDIINSQSSKAIVDTIIGETRYETAAMISDHQNYTTAILVNADNSVADGLSASGLSGVLNAPILLTKKDIIPSETEKRLKGVSKVYIIGQENSVSKIVENNLRSKNIEVTRLGGIDRIQTSYEVAKEMKRINPDIDEVFLVNGYKGEADAMSVSSVANRDKAPIILTNGQSIPFSTNNIESYVIGSTSTMSNNIVTQTNSTRLGGIDRFATNKIVIEKFYPNTNEFYISKGYVLVDALTVSPLAKNYPVVLVHQGSDKSVVKNATKLIQVGGMDKDIMDECISAVK
ncbi:cell wall-binding repeat-containing protein [Romboutsia ilealis]|uniref:cell wall-binding repeat-containing protein n=1 Tax=Romboutsia ilealis TaxID=1115758 RepID=UPI0028980112|nr:cell wall-binding repeat-containing protein [Romboutsia ilealis]